MNQTLTKRVIARYQSKHNPPNFYSWKFNPCEASYSNFKAISVTQVELSALEFLVCTEECVNEDAKKKEKEKEEKEKKRTLSVCCV